MTKPLVQLKFEYTDTGYSHFDTIEVFVNGKSIGKGYYGGEPEDNSRSRDYVWVEEVIKSLAKELGATVQVQY